MTQKVLTEKRKLALLAAAIRRATYEASCFGTGAYADLWLSHAKRAEEAAGPVDDRVVLADVREVLGLLAKTGRGALSMDARLWLDQSWLVGHWYRGHDGATYKVTEFVDGDGPRIELLPGVTEPCYPDADTRTRTVSMRAIGATFHHSKNCPCGGGHW